MNVRDRAAEALTRGRVTELERRVADLERQLVESQQLHQRVAELVDVVSELMVPLATRDEERIQAVLSTYVDELGS